MPIGEGIDAREAALGIAPRGRCHGLDPACQMLAVEHLGQRPARRLRFGQRADATLAQPWHQGEEDRSRAPRVTRRPMPVAELDPEPDR